MEAEDYLKSRGLKSVDYVGSSTNLKEVDLIELIENYADHKTEHLHQRIKEYDRRWERLSNRDKIRALSHPNELEERIKQMDDELSMLYDTIESKNLEIQDLEYDKEQLLNKE